MKFFYVLYLLMLFVLNIIVYDNFAEARDSVKNKNNEIAKKTKIENDSKIYEVKDVEEFLNKLNIKDSLLHKKESLKIFNEVATLTLENYVAELSLKQKSKFYKAAIDGMEKYLVDFEKKFGKEKKSNLSYSIIIEEGIKSMVSSLDDHSIYFNKNEYKEFRNSINGEYVGIGIVLGVDEVNNGIKVMQVLEDSPAFEAGIMENDLIISIDSVVIKDKDVSKTISFIKGKKNSNIVLKIKRGNEEKEFKVKRKKINFPVVQSKVIDDKFAYIKINEFNNKLVPMFRENLEKIKGEQLKGVVIDLRNNPGGLLNQTLVILDMLLTKNKVLSIKGRKVDSEVIYFTGNNMEFLKNIPIVVLVNNLSASASEIFAAAISQNNRGIVMGYKTYGKGSVQTMYDVSDGSAVKLTVQLYYTSDGTTIQNYGVVPEIEFFKKKKEAWDDIHDENRFITEIGTLSKKKSKMVINSDKCEAVLNYSKKEDKELGCAILYLKTLDLKKFEKNLKNE
jgi:carboxyl-terminal processing protease